MRKRTEMSKALKVWEQVIANNNRNDDLIEQFYFLCKEEAKEEVKERIIKLLEKNNNCNGGLSSGNCTCAAIALIKGEQK